MIHLINKVNLLNEANIGIDNINLNSMLIAYECKLGRKAVQMNGLHHTIHTSD